MNMNKILSQEHVKRGLEVAVAGNHSVLLIGPPNSGKNMLKEACKSIGNIPIYIMEPCPCGFFTDPEHECNCTPRQIQAYLNMTVTDMEALNHAVDIHLEVPRLKLEHLTEKRRGECSEDIKVRITRSKMRDLDRGSVARELDKEAEELCKLAILELGISHQAYDKILQVANTIAMLDGKNAIEAHHISEAISYRSLDRNLWG